MYHTPIDSIKSRSVFDSVRAFLRCHPCAVRYYNSVSFHFNALYCDHLKSRSVYTVAAGASWLDTALFITLTAEVITSDEIRILTLYPTSIENFDVGDGVENTLHTFSLTLTQRDSWLLCFHWGGTTLTTLAGFACKTVL